MIQINIRTPSAFAAEIENLVKEKKNIPYIDAIVLYCEKNELEIETAATMIRMCPTIKAKIESEAADLNYIKQGGKLPI